MTTLRMYEQMFNQHRDYIGEEDWDDTTIAIMLGVYDEWRNATDDDEDCEDCDDCDDGDY